MSALRIRAKLRDLLSRVKSKPQAPNRQLPDRLPLHTVASASATQTSTGREEKVHANDGEKNSTLAI